MGWRVDPVLSQGSNSSDNPPCHVLKTSKNPEIAKKCLKKKRRIGKVPPPKKNLPLVFLAPSDLKSILQKPTHSIFGPEKLKPHFYLLRRQPRNNPAQKILKHKS